VIDLRQDCFATPGTKEIIKITQGALDMSARILELVDIFSDLSPQQLEKIYNICSEETYTQGQVIFEERSPSKEIYIVIEGEVEILVNANPTQDQFEDRDETAVDGIVFR
jgi:signal-transduction protein with cAMP-binding, CBS, and nucleotidyltransferase domain